ncbi:MAG: hypothetical protein E7812_02130 [Phenylobacterium sp.]|nr:MAG: hypothetical protein E7812_02130 [Phenylobacterium sp.]
MKTLPLRLASCLAALAAVATPAASASLAPPGGFAFAAIDDIVILGRITPLPPPPQPAGPAPVRYYAEKAQAARIEGHATLRCRLAASGGTVSACQVIEETPFDEGFGDAALGMAPLFHFPATVHDVADGVILIPFQFKLDGPAAEPTPPRVNHPSFTALPTPDSAAAVIHRAAPAARGPVWGAVDCQVGPEGRLNSCRKITESPEGSGVAGAAAALAEASSIRTRDSEGRSLAGARLLLVVHMNP